MDIKAAIAHLDAAKALLIDLPVPGTTVRAGDSLQAALDTKLPLVLEAGAQFTGSFLVPSGTRLSGLAGAAVRGQTAPALILPPGTADVIVDGLEASSQHSEVISIGENTANQIQVADAPDQITFSNVKIPTHRGKRAFAIHGQHVSLLNCEAVDVYDPAGSDSQAIYIGNTPGPVTVRGGRYSAGSEVFLSGGDNMKIPHVTPDGITVEDVELFRPLTWQTDGIKRKVKNLFEIKNGQHVILRRSKLSGCWQDGQAGEAIVLTPALDGAITSPPRQSGEVTDVLIEDVTVTNCGSVANLLGRAYTSYTINPLSGVMFRRVKATVNRAQYGGRGQFAIIQGEPADIAVEDCDFVGDGTSTIYYSPGTCLDPVTFASRPAGRLGSLSVTNSRMTLGQYGFMFGGSANAFNWGASVVVLTVTGNTFSGGYTAMQKILPTNVYL